MSDDNSIVEATYWWGIPTLFRCPHETDPGAVDIALVGVPHSSGNGTTERDQHLGPRAVRNYSTEYRRFHAVYGTSPWDQCRVGDMGDTPLPHALNNERALKDIENFYAKLDAANARPVSIGGDHSIPLPILRSIAGPNSNIASEPVALIHFDAHFDTAGGEDHFMGCTEWSGSFARIICEEGLVDPSNVFQIGIRGHGFAEDDSEFSRSVGYNVIDRAEVARRGIPDVLKQIRETIDDKPTYITFDLDVLDPTEAPGVANVEPGFAGLRMQDALDFFHGMRGMNIIGGDIACLMPTKDSPNGITTTNATVVMFEMISLIADYLDRGKG